MTNETLTEKIVGIPSRMVVPYTVPTLIKHMDFFNRMSNLGKGNLEELAREFGADTRIFGATLAYLVKEGFIQRDSDSRYSLSPETQNLLTSRGEYNLTPFAMILDTTLPGDLEKAIALAIKTGKPAEWKSGEAWAEAMKSGAIARHFSDGMMARGKLLSAALSKSLSKELQESAKLLDIGGSLGDYCGRFTQDYNNLECTVFDLPSVASHAKENVATKKYGRVNVLAGDFFAEDFPQGYDTHLLSNVIHDWPVEKARIILAKSLKSLKVGGKAIVHGLHLDDDLKGPAVAIDHSLYLAMMTEGRCYSYGEIESIMKESGFVNLTSRKTVGGYGVVIGEKER